MKPTFSSALLLIFLATVTFYSCEKIGRSGYERDSKGDVKVGGTLKVALSATPQSYLPGMITDAISSEVGTHIHNGLLNLDPNTLEVIPGIAERWSIDNKGTSYVFNLRSGVKFHDDECFGGVGREITAHDFKYSFELLCGNENNDAFATTFRNRVTGANEFHDGKSDQVLGVQVIDDYTLRIELEKPDESFLFVLAQPSTAVVSQKAYLKYGASCKVGAGPFEILSTEGAVVMTRNLEHYLHDPFGNQLPYIDTLVFIIEPSKQAQLESFLIGNLDLVSGLYLDPVRSILEQHIADFSGKAPKYVMQRETESAGYESYRVYGAGMKGFGSNFMGYRDFSRVQVEQ